MARHHGSLRGRDWDEAEAEGCHPGARSGLGRAPKHQRMTTNNAIDPRKPVSLYTDGSGEGKKNRPAGWGVTAVQNKHIVWEAAGTETGADAQKMELKAVATALDAVPANAPARVVTDCMWCRDIAGPKGRRWRNAGWCNSTTGNAGGKPVSHSDLAEQVVTTLETRPQCQVRWIKGHKGNRWNMRAHALAQQTIEPGAPPPLTRAQTEARKRARAKRLAAALADDTRRHQTGPPA